MSNETSIPLSVSNALRSASYLLFAIDIGLVSVDRANSTFIETLRKDLATAESQGFRDAKAIKTNYGAAA